MIKERLLSLPDEIKEMKVELINVDNRLQHYNDEIKKWELQELDSIASETDENGIILFNDRHLELANEPDVELAKAEIRELINKILKMRTIDRTELLSTLRRIERVL